MNTPTTILAALFALTSLASGQTEELYNIDRPPGIFNGWGHALEPVQDLTGDGVTDLVIGVMGHGGGVAASVHSGADGALLYTLNAPFTPLFFGDGIVSVSDQSGDGVAELVVVGSHSGDQNSPEGLFRVHSGADGTLLHEFSPPAGLFLLSNSQSSLRALADVDGDGSEDVLARSYSAQGRSMTLFSSATGQVLYSVLYAGSAFSIGIDVALMSDHDHDGLDDFAVTVQPHGSDPYYEIRSAATGALLSSAQAKALIFQTGNLEPFLSVADADGDGLRDLVGGAVFAGFTGSFSSRTGGSLVSWECAPRGIPCFGSRVIEIGDFTGDGRPDLLAMESMEFISGEVSLFGLDPATGAVVFEDTQLALPSGYQGSDRLVAFPNAGGAGELTFAMLESGNNRVSVRRVLLRP
jgi:hypothetical protein